MFFEFLLKKRCFSRYFEIIRDKMPFFWKKLPNSRNYSRMLPLPLPSSESTRNRVAAENRGKASPVTPT